MNEALYEEPYIHSFRLFRPRTTVAESREGEVVCSPSSAFLDSWAEACCGMNLMTDMRKKPSGQGGIRGSFVLALASSGYGGGIQRGVPQVKRGPSQMGWFCAVVVVHTLSPKYPLEE